MLSLEEAGHGDAQQAKASATLRREQDGVLPPEAAPAPPWRLGRLSPRWDAPRRRAEAHRPPAGEHGAGGQGGQGRGDGGRSICPSPPAPSEPAAGGGERQPAPKKPGSRFLPNGHLLAGHQIVLEGCVSGGRSSHYRAASPLRFCPCVPATELRLRDLHKAPAIHYSAAAALPYALARGAQPTSRLLGQGGPQEEPGRGERCRKSPAVNDQDASRRLAEATPRSPAPAMLYLRNPSHAFPSAGRAGDASTFPPAPPRRGERLLGPERGRWL